MKATAGFTYIELLISISIVAVLTGFMVARFRSGDHTQQLLGAAELLSTYIRESQNKALSGIDAAQSRAHGVVLHASQSNFEIYQDLKLGSNNYLYDGNDLLTQSQVFDSVVSLSDVDIVYDIPAAGLYINGVEQTSTPTTIVLEHTATSKRITVTVLPLAGQVSIGSPY